jgi:hypothetical protein
MGLYQKAVEAVRNTVEETQADLDAVAVKAREANIAALRSAIMGGVQEDSPTYSVCALLAHTVTIGREDGYPEVNMPEDTKSVLSAAKQAGMFRRRYGHVCIGETEWYADLSGMAVNLPSHVIDCDAWDSAKKYRDRQTLSSL